MLALRRLTGADVDTLTAFVARVPAADRTFFKVDLDAPGAVARMIDDPGTRAAGAFDGDALAGFVGVHRLPGWSAHVAELRLVVDPQRRRQGVGTALTREALRLALRDGARKVVVEAVAEQEPTIALFTAHGFEPEALLRAHIRDARGVERDLILLAHHVADNQDAMAMTGLADALGEAAGP